MTTPCRLGLKCIHLVDDDDGEPCCIYPWTLGTLTEERFEADATSCDEMPSCECKLVEKGSDLEYLLEMADEYNPEEWKNLMNRLSVHLGRPYEASASRHKRIAETKQQLWAEYWAERSRDEGI